MNRVSYYSTYASMVCTGEIVSEDVLISIKDHLWQEGRGIPVVHCPWGDADKALENMRVVWKALKIEDPQQTVSTAKKKEMVINYFLTLSLRNICTSRHNFQLRQLVKIDQSDKFYRVVGFTPKGLYRLRNTTSQKRKVADPILVEMDLKGRETKMIK